MIYLNCSNDLDYPQDPLFVQRENVRFISCWCYSDWWYSKYRLSPGQVRIHIDCTNEGQLETTKNVISWIRSLYLDARLVSLAENRYAAELQYLEEDRSDKIFFGLCLIRLLSDEFIDSIPSNVSCRKFLEQVFLSYPKNFLHLPLVDPFSIQGDAFDVKSPGPEFGSVLFGRGKYAFWTQRIQTRAWGTYSICAAYPNRSTGIYAREWLHFYEDWVKTEDASLDY